MKFKEIIYVIFVIIVLWIGITSQIFRSINPSATEMQAFYHIPKSIILDFKFEKE